MVKHLKIILLVLVVASASYAASTNYYWDYPETTELEPTDRILVFKGQSTAGRDRNITGAGLEQAILRSGKNAALGNVSTSKIVVGTTAPTTFTLSSDPVRVPTIPVAVFQPSASATETRAAILDLMPTSVDGYRADNRLGTGESYIDLVDRDLRNSADPGSWAVGRMAMSASPAGPGSKGVFNVGGFSGGTGINPQLSLYGNQIWFSDYTAPGGVAGFMRNGDLNWGAWDSLLTYGSAMLRNNGDLLTVGKIGVETAIPTSPLHITNLPVYGGATMAAANTTAKAASHTKGAFFIYSTAGSRVAGIVW